MVSATDPEALLARARLTFDIEAAAVLGLKERLGPSFPHAVQKILDVRKLAKEQLKVEADRLERVAG